MGTKKNHKNTTLTEAQKERRLLNAHYGAKEASYRRRLLAHLRFERPRYWWANESRWWQKLGCIVLAVLILMVSGMYGIARWYIAKNSHRVPVFGTTFIPDYARSFDLDPEVTLDALIHDMNFRHFRLVSYWDDIEPEPGQYDFSELDWQFKKIESVGGSVSLAVGLRQPRWPECHMPSWAMNQPDEQWQPALKTFMGKVIDRYKTSPALKSYQLENEYFLKVFGECKNFDRDRLVDEFNFVKQKDPNHTVIISRSNNALGLPIGKPTPDMFGVSVYKRVWDKTLTHRYFEYPFPAWFYAFLAGAGEIVTGKDMIVHELQAEPWPAGGDIKSASIAEQDKSLNARRLKDRIIYGKATGMGEIDLWGSEMWYWRKVKLGDSSLWDTARETIRDQQCTKCYSSR